MTTAFVWAMVALLTAACVGAVYRVGKAEKPLTPRVAAAAIAIRVGLIVWGVAAVLS